MIKPVLSDPLVNPFRKEALAHVTDRQFGHLIVTAPPGHNLIGLLCGLTSAALLICLLFIHLSERVDVSGRLIAEGGIAKIASPRIGRVIRVVAKEGAEVEKNQLLFEISADNIINGGEELSTVIQPILLRRRAILTEQIENTRQQASNNIGELSERISHLTGQRLQLEDQLTLQTQEIELARETLHRFESLVQSRFISEAAVAEKKKALFDSQQKELEIRALLLENAGKRSAIRFEINDAQNSETKAVQALEEKITDLEEQELRNYADGKTEIRAPSAGTLTNVTCSDGQSVKAGDFLAEIVPPNAKLAGELFVSSAQIGKIEVGAPVQVKYLAFPYQTFGQYDGRVLSISKAGVAPIKGRSDVAETVDEAYKIIVQLQNQSVRRGDRTYELKPGMGISVSVPVEEKPIYRWALDGAVK